MGRVGVGWKEEGRTDGNGREGWAKGRVRLGWKGGRKNVKEEYKLPLINNRGGGGY